MRRLLEAFYKNLVVPVQDFIYPPLCFLCDKRLENGGVRMCGECWPNFPSFHVGDPVWHELKNRFAQDGAVSDFLSCFYFEQQGRLQKVIHLLKYQGIRSMGVMLGKEIGYRILQSTAFGSADVLLPVPLHKLRQRERGFNQSEIICEGISTVTGIPTRANVIHRVKYTQSQTKLNLEERRSNVGDAFRINPHYSEAVKRKRVILVDDVITTGSTISACAKELVREGAEFVLAASAAVAL